MSNLTITNVNLSNVILRDGEFQDTLLTFTGAGVVVAGTILARDSVSLNLVPFVKGGVSNGNGIPKAVLTYDVEATAAGDVAIRNMVSGAVREQLLIIDADGDGSNVDAEVLDQLRNYGLVSIEVDELNDLDNQ